MDAVQALEKVAPIIGPAGFAGLVAIVLLYIIHRILDSHTKMMIELTMTLKHATETLEKIVDSLDKLKDHIERRSN